jgi:hypothetical protein
MNGIENVIQVTIFFNTVLGNYVTNFFWHLCKQSYFFNIIFGNYVTNKIGHLRERQGRSLLQDSLFNF